MYMYIRLTLEKQQVEFLFQLVVDYLLRAMSVSSSLRDISCLESYEERVLEWQLISMCKFLPSACHVCVCFFPGEMDQCNPTCDMFQDSSLGLAAHLFLKRLH